MVWRRFRLSGETSLAAFHYLIQITQGWQNDQLHQFHIYGLWQKLRHFLFRRDCVSG
ncbi:IS1096 element passenger TnpR family protein [Xenorhabdus miraniensis]|uniref:IS1096 element passenger TnpR family protein n=1 Tax=Xenorhabdus miraniensis TaxID=351674 RepID=UPI00244B0060|nr:hypothetical protein [Xenorhabdus miraniensis]